MAEKQLSQAAQWDHEFVWHPFTQMQDWLAQEPVVIERGEGVYLIDENGKKYYGQSYPLVPSMLGLIRDGYDHEY